MHRCVVYDGELDSDTSSGIVVSSRSPAVGQRLKGETEPIVPYSSTVVPSLLKLLPFLNADSAAVCPTAPSEPGTLAHKFAFAYLPTTKACVNLRTVRIYKRLNQYRIHE